MTQKPNITSDDYDTLSHDTTNDEHNFMDKLPLCGIRLSLCISNSLGPWKKSSGFSLNDTSSTIYGIHIFKNYATEVPKSPKCSKNSKCNSLVVEPTHLKNISQLGNLPQFSGWTKKTYLKPPARQQVVLFKYQSCWCWVLDSVFFSGKRMQGIQRIVTSVKGDNGIQLNQLSFHTLFSSMSFKISSSCIKFPLQWYSSKQVASFLWCHRRFYICPRPLKKNIISYTKVKVDGTVTLYWFM